MPINSPWNHEVELTSPDGRYRALYVGQEIGMGAPTSGTLRIVSNTEAAEVVFECLGVGASMLWTPDSKYLIATQWGAGAHDQTIVVIDVSTAGVHSIYPGYKIVELTNIHDHHLHGIDSPAYQPREFSLDLSALRT